MKNKSFNISNMVQDVHKMLLNDDIFNSNTLHYVSEIKAFL